MKKDGKLTCALIFEMERVEEKVCTLSELSWSVIASDESVPDWECVCSGGGSHEEGESCEGGSAEHDSKGVRLGYNWWIWRINSELSTEEAPGYQKKKRNRFAAVD